MNLNPLLEWWGALVFVHCFPDCVGLRACIGCVSVPISLLKRCGESSVGWIQANPVIFDGEFDWFTGMIRSSCFGEMLFRSYKRMCVIRSCLESRFAVQEVCWKGHLHDEGKFSHFGWLNWTVSRTDEGLLHWWNVGQILWNDVCEHSVSWLLIWSSKGSVKKVFGWFW